MFIKETDFNNNKFIFPFNNGVYDIKQKFFRKGLYEEYITMTCGYDYKVVDSRDAFDSIKDIIPNENILPWFLTIISSYLVDVHQREEFFVLYNKRGNNGKSTLMNVFSSTFGKFFYSCKSNLLLEQKFTGNGEEASPTLMNMRHKRMISYQETKSGVKLEPEVIKRLTGGDIINGRKLYEDTAEFQINGIQILSCNEPPAFTHIDGAIIRRLRCIAMETEFVVNPTLPHHREVRDICSYTSNTSNPLRYSMFQLLTE